MYFEKLNIIKKIFIIWYITMLSGCGTSTVNKPIDFKNLNYSRPNYYLLCPKGLVTIDYGTAPIYKVNANKLYKITLSIIDNMQRTEMVYQDDDNYQLVFIQRSRMFRFPDYIDIHIFPVDQISSTIAIFSRAKYGYYDFGINKSRVVNIIDEISKLVNKIE